MSAPAVMLPVPGARAVREWVGATPDTPVPPRVKDRVFRRHNGICHVSGRKIMPGEPWDAEHVIAIINGGENRESNLRPALTDKHREKTATDMAEKSKTYQKRKANLGIKKSSMWGDKQKRLKRKVDGTVIDRDTGEQVWPRT